MKSETFSIPIEVDLNWLASLDEADAFTSAQLEIESAVVDLRNAMWDWVLAIVAECQTPGPADAGQGLRADGMLAAERRIFRAARGT